MVTDRTIRSLIRPLLLFALTNECAAASSYNDQNVYLSPSQQWSPPPPPPDRKVQPDQREQPLQGSQQQQRAESREQDEHTRPPPPGPSNLEATRSWDRIDRPQFARPETTTHTPIDYQFRSRQSDRTSGVNRARLGRNRELQDDIPVTAVSYDDPLPVVDDNVPKFATPRQDAVGRYMSTFKGRLALRSSSALVGVALGSFVGKSLFNAPTSFGVAIGIVLTLLTFVRNPYGELARALGLTLIFVWQRTFQIRRRYATWPHIKASLGVTTRTPFPRNDDFQSREISFVYTLIAMGFVGSAAGGNLPLVPTWMGATGGAGLMVFLTTLRNARGDLCRSMGMRLVAVVEELLDINAELKVVQKSGVVAGRILDKILILDRKHSIKDRIASALTFMYEQIASATGRMDRRRGDTDREEGRRRDNRDDEQRRSRDDQRPLDRQGDRRRDDRDVPRRDDRRRDDRDDRRRFDEQRRGGDGPSGRRQQGEVDRDRSEGRQYSRQDFDNGAQRDRRNDFGGNESI
jgi:hypothetical protein